MLVKKTMNMKLEYFNVGTGLCLCVAGLFYLAQQDYATALNWGIFGAMYLVMDDYKPMKPEEKPPLRRLREVFGAVGFTLSVVLLLYLFLIQ